MEVNAIDETHRTDTAITTEHPSGSPTSLAWAPRLWGVLFVCCFALFLDALDVSMVSVALPSIGADLALSTTQLQWVVTGYVLTFGGLLLLGGRIADLLGRRRVFLVALAVFAAASLMGAVVDSGILLIVSRVLKGIAAACTAPAAMSIVTTTFREGKDRNKALSIFAIFGACGYSFGLIFSGFLTELGWRWTFIMPAPVAIGVLIAGYFLIPRHKPTGNSGFDVLGALTLTSGLLLGVYSIVTLPESDHLSMSLGTLAASILLLASFIAIEKKVRYPLIRLGIFHNRPVVRANLIKVALLGSFLSFQFIMTLYLQTVLGWSPLQMALALAPTGVMVMIISPLTGRLVTRYGPIRLIMISLGSLSAAFVVFLVFSNTNDPSYAVHLLPSVILMGVGFGFGVSPTIAQGTSGVADSEQGLASGLINTSGQVGGAIVLACVTALISAGAGATASVDAGINQFRPGIFFITAVVIAGLAVASSAYWFKEKPGKTRQSQRPLSHRR